MPIEPRHPSYADCVAKALSSSSRPLTIDELIQAIADDRSLGAGVRSAVYRAINKLFQAVQVAPGVFGWISTILTGNIVRHQLSTEETRRGYILLDELEHIFFFPDFFQRYRPDNRQVTVELFGGPTLTGIPAIERKTWSLRVGNAFSHWIDDLGGQGGDDLIITVIDAYAGKYAMRLQPHEIRDEASIRQRNVALARLAEELVSEDRRTRPAVPSWELAAKLIGRGVYAHQPPVDDLHYVLHEYSALRLTDGLGYQTDVDATSVPHARRYEATSFPNPREGREANRQMDDAYRNDQSGSDSEFDTGPEDELDDFDRFLHQESSHAYTGTSNGNGDDHNGDDSECEFYAQYLQLFEEQRRGNEQPLSHEDFHLLEAELELLVRLEIEFGRLLGEQERRKLNLADQLFIDPNSLADADWDMSDGEDYEDPPFWQN